MQASSLHYDMLAAILFALLSVPLSLPDQATEHVDLIELNHFYDQAGHPVYDQVVFYERAPETGRFQVRAWCLVEDRELLNRRPVKNEVTGIYQVDWFDTDQRLQRKITSRLYRESWTQVDPERANKRVHDERLRISLIKRSGRGNESLGNSSGLVASSTTNGDQ